MNVKWERDRDSARASSQREREMSERESEEVCWREEKERGEMPHQQTNEKQVQKGIWEGRKGKGIGEGREWRGFHTKQNINPIMHLIALDDGASFPE